MAGGVADTRVLILAAIQFGFTLASYGIGIFLPLILKEYHLSNWAIGWIAAIPYLFASAGMILWARYVDQKGRRVVNLAIACLLGGAGLLAPIVSGSLAIASDGVQRGPGRRHRGAGDLLVDPDALPDRCCRRGRARLHQQYRHRRRFRRSVHDGLVEGILRLLRRRPDRGGRHHDIAAVASMSLKLVVSKE